MLKLLGFTGIECKKKLTKAQFETGKAKLDEIDMKKVSQLFQKKRIFKGVPSKSSNHYILAFLNPIWKLLYDIEIVAYAPGKTKSDEFYIKESELFEYDRNAKGSGIVKVCS
jgi:hypothetical protein